MDAAFFLFVTMILWMNLDINELIDYLNCLSKRFRYTVIYANYNITVIAVVPFIAKPEDTGKPGARRSYSIQFDIIMAESSSRSFFFVRTRNKREFVPD